MISERHPLVAQPAAHHRHLLDRAATVTPVRMRVTVPPNRCAHLGPSLGDRPAGSGLEPAQIGRYLA